MRKIYYQNVLLVTANNVSRIMFGLLNSVCSVIRVIMLKCFQVNAINVQLICIVKHVKCNIKCIRMDGNGKSGHFIVQEHVHTIVTQVLIRNVQPQMQMIMKSIVHHVKKVMNSIMKNAFQSVVVPNVLYRMIYMFVSNVPHL